MLTIERLCERIIYLTHTPIRVYRQDGSLERVYLDNGEMQDPVACDPQLLAGLLERRRKDFPVIHVEEDVIWGIFCGEDSVYVMGPCCLGEDAAAAARRLVRAHNMDRKKAYRVAQTTLMEFAELLLILYECLTGVAMNASKMLMKNVCDARFEKALHEKTQQVFFRLQEDSFVHNPYSQERIEQESIRTGDLEGLYRSFEITYMGRIGKLADDPLRQTKNLAVVVITLASRSAIEGGLQPEIAFTMSDAYIQRAEELDTPEKVGAMIRQVEVEYCQAVANLAGSRPRSAVLIRAKDLIAQRIQSRIRVKDLAQELGISPDYLAQLFEREEGVKPAEYILRQKIVSARHMLAYTNSSFSDIAHALAFSSQSHFGQAFKKITGVTPKQYRETYGQGGTGGDSSD